ncbi:MAG TPA: DUF2231 domain-containing protein [Steroidobacteraceae bacterium]|nr:DUF2231 domain-containing protein [Steroidobacteraceae bacterium]
MIPVFEWHPIAVHFPLALTVTAALALGAARLPMLARHAETLALVGTWNLCLGAVGLLFALGTGLAAVTGLDLAPAARAAVAAHVKWAMFSSAALSLVAVWRGAGTAARSLPSRLFLGVLWAATLALVMTGYRGGQNVYRFGVGVEGHGHELERD